MTAQHTDQSTESSPSQARRTDAVADRSRTDVETDVPPDAAVHRCGYCGRPFAEASYLVLHRGLAHPTELTDAERTAFEDAYEAEQSDIQRFRIVALGLLVVLYFGFLFAFAIVT